MNPVQYISESGKWTDLVIMGETIYDMCKAIDMVRASTRSKIKLQQISDVGAGVYEWNNF